MQQFAIFCAMAPTTLLYMGPAISGPAAEPSLTDWIYNDVPLEIEN
jgi:hypothetical protein